MNYFLALYKLYCQFGFLLQYCRWNQTLSYFMAARNSTTVRHSADMSKFRMADEKP